PTVRPSDRPTVRPSDRPTVRPSDRPTVRPSDRPTVRPSDRPTVRPSDRPTLSPDRPVARSTASPYRPPRPVALSSYVPSRALLVALLLLGGCQPTAARRGATVLFASGADLQSMNPLVTLHPLARQVQRYVLLTTLARYDSALVPRPYLARGWTWSDDRRSLVLHLVTGVRWDDGVPT